MEDQLVWKVKTAKDLGAGAWYRYSVQGEIINGSRKHEEFSWSVPNLDSPYYDLTEAVWEKPNES
jgi:hypothetical protein